MDGVFMIGMNFVVHNALGSHMHMKARTHNIIQNIILCTHCKYYNENMVYGHIVFVFYIRKRKIYKMLV